ncbi:uncharacterized protein QYS62_008272 [Fusarium acuminatum]|uniref:Protein kinase domain-containing protein n=1 Tax=Fusarium acuminatum TaxID=5515 RepID=A0ABZ2X3U3_9HYPO
MATRSDNIEGASVWGDFIGLDDEGNVEDISKPTERYKDGLYYPIYIKEILIDRYRIKHKLGHGGFLTIWMANVDVALKIITPGQSGKREFAT